jgi:hypothetical protein
VLTFLSRVLLFLSAFAPLFFIWGLHAWPSPGAYAFLVLVVIGVIGTLFVVRSTRQDEGRTMRLMSAEPRQSDTAAYVVTYLFPFVVAPTNSVQDWLTYLVFIGILLALYISSDLISINPLLALRGLRLYRVDLDRAGAVWLLSDFRPVAETELCVNQLVEGVYVAIRVVT